MNRSVLAKLEVILLCLLLLLAAWLRLGHIDQVEFQWDQSEISKWAIQMARGGQFTWIGPVSSTGIDSFPGAPWVLSIPYALSPSPVFATGFIAALNVLAVIGCYFLARHWFGRKAALITALLFAVAPWAVIYSRKIWQVDLFAPFAVLYAATGWQAFVRGRRWALTLHALTLSALVLIHFTAGPFVLLTMLWTVIFFRRLDWRVVLASAVLAALPFIPYFVVDAQQDWQNVERAVAFTDLPAETDLDAAQAIWVVSTGTDMHWLTGPERYEEYVAEAPNARWLFVVEGGLVVVALAAALARAARRAREELDDETAAVVMAATWLTMPALFLLRHNNWVAPHYVTSSFPAQFILVGWLLARVMNGIKGPAARFGRWTIAGVVIVLAGAQVYEVTSVLRFVSVHDTVNGFGTPIAYEVEAVDTAHRLGEAIGSEEVILLSMGDEPRMYEMPNAADILMYGEPHRAVDVRTALVFPDHPAVYWATYDPTFGEEWLATFTPEVVEARIPLREGHRSFRFYRWSGGAPQLDCLQPLPGGSRVWENGAELIGTCLEGDPRPGETIRWTLIWRPRRTPEEDIYYHWFNHLLDGQGEVVVQADGPSLLPAYWREGDTILNWFEITLPTDAPAGPYVMRVGMYRWWPTTIVGNVPLVDGDGPSVEYVTIEVE